MTQDQIFTAGSAAAHYLKKTLLQSLPEDCRDIYLIGQAGLEDELRDVGLSWTGGTQAEDLVPMPNQVGSGLVDVSESSRLKGLYRHRTESPYRRCLAGI